LFFVRDHRPESDEVFGDILPAFESAEHATELLKYYTEHDTIREAKAAAARAAIADRTFDNAAIEAMQLMETAGIL
jgi:hypothetical protein